MSNETATLDLDSLLYICENFADRGEQATADLFNFMAGREEDCSSEGLAEISDWLLVTAMRLADNDPLAEEVDELAKRIDDLLDERDWKHPIIEDLQLWLREDFDA